MNPVTHFLVGWGVANSAALERRDRALVAAAGVAPDLDGLGIVTDLLTRHTAAPTEWWGAYHHVLGHNLAFGALVTALAFKLGRRRPVTAALACVSLHLHLLGDVVGSRGPDGYQWPIPYLSRFSESWQWVWSGQWALNAWPNFAITSALLATTLYLAWHRGFSPLELVSDRANRSLVEALRGRFGAPAASAEGAA